MPRAAGEGRTKFNVGISRRKGVALALSALIATGLNLAALQVYGDLVSQWKRGVLAGAPPPALERIELVPPRPSEPPLLPSNMATNQAATRSSPHADIDAPSNADDIEAATNSHVAVRYYRITEVDAPATPHLEWELDPSTLDILGIERLVFEVHVSDTGQIVSCRILEPATLAPGARKSMEARLRGTALIPARKAGRDVASTRRIELTVLPPAE